MPSLRNRSLVAVALATAVAVPFATGSSHREAPNIMLDPSADNTDTYAFTAKDAPNALTVVANWVPGGNPANGPNFFRFDDRARYYIHIDNTGDGKPDVSYRYTFVSQFSNTSYTQADQGVTSFDDPKLFQKQRYTIVRETRTDGRITGEKEIGKDLPVAPSNAGPKTFPDYAKLNAEQVRQIGDSKYFAGQRNDAFFIDLGSAFDNINLKLGTGNTGAGEDTQSGTSIQTITMQVPESEVTRDGKPVMSPADPNAVVGVWATTERRKIQVTNARFDKIGVSRGSFVQVSRLGMPLTNELFIPAGLKDGFNRNRPDTDAKRYVQFLQRPELAEQLNDLYSINAPTTGRDDLVQYLGTGIPGLNQIAPGAPVTDTLKLNLGTPPATTPNRFGVIGGDNAGFPNGRRLEDDATDIYVQLAAGFLKGNRLPLGDGVDRDDKPFLETFPYQSIPDPGFGQKPSDRVEPTHAPTAPGNNPPVPGG